MSERWKKRPKFNYSQEQDIGSVALYQLEKLDLADEASESFNSGVDAQVCLNQENTSNQMKKISTSVHKKEDFVAFFRDSLSEWPLGKPHIDIIGLEQINFFRLCRFVSRLATRLILMQDETKESKTELELVQFAIELLHRIPFIFNTDRHIREYVRSNKNADGSYTHVPLEYKEHWAEKKIAHGHFTKFYNKLLNKTKGKNSQLRYENNENKEDLVNQDQKLARELEKEINFRERNAFENYFQSLDKTAPITISSDEESCKNIEEEEKEDTSRDKIQEKNNENLNTFAFSDELFLTEEELDHIDFQKKQKEAYNNTLMTDLYFPFTIETLHIQLSVCWFLGQQLKKQNSYFTNIHSYLSHCMEEVGSTENRAFNRQVRSAPRRCKAIILQLIQSLHVFECINKAEEDHINISVEMIRNLAENLLIVGENCRHDQQLTRFIDAHLVSIQANLVLCPFFPDETISKIARPYDFNSFDKRTPFDIMRNMFHFHLKPFQCEEDLALFLEHCIRIAESIQFHINELPWDMVSSNYISWYLAIVSSIMLASSGVFALSSNENNQTFENDDLCVDLDIFRQYRTLTLQFLHRLTSFAIEKKSFEYNLMLSSFLEWDHVIFLVCGKSLQKNKSETSLSLRRWYSYCTFQYLKEYTDIDVSRQLLMIFREKQYISTQDFLDYLADSFEHTSLSSGSALLYLVQELGPVGKLSTSEDQGDHNKCGDIDCKECRLLHRSLYVPHNEIKMLKEGGIWWGNKRQWWYPTLLSIPFSFSEENDFCEDHTNQVSTILNFLSDDIIHAQYLNALSRTFNLKDCLRNFDPDNKVWIDPDLLEVDDLFHFSEYKNELPLRLNDIMLSETNSEPSLALNSLFSLKSNSIKKENEICTEISYKIIVACHLFNVSHPFVSMGVNYLLNICCKSIPEDVQTLEKNDMDNNHSLLCLRWLQIMGLNIAKFSPV